MSDLKRPTVNEAGNVVQYPQRGVPYAATDLEAMPQNTIALAADGVLVFIRPRHYSQPAFKCSVFNIGPGAISMRWDGKDTTYGDPAAVLLPAGTGYAEAIGVRIALAADASGATVSMTAESYYG